MNYTIMPFDKRRFFAVCAVALVVRLGLWALPHPLLETGDQSVYRSLAFTFLETGDYGITPGEPTADRLPGYPLFLAALFAVSGSNQPFVIFCQCLMGALTASLAMGLALNARGRLATGLILAFYPILAIYPMQILTENLFFLLLVLVLLGSRSFEAQPSLMKALGLGALLAGLSLTRNVGLGIAAGLLGGALWRRETRRLAVAGLFIFCLIYSAWVARNRIVFGSPILTSSNGGTVFYIGNGPEATGWYHENLAPLEGIADERERSRIGYELAWEHIKQSPLAWLGLLAKKAVFFWEPYDHPADWILWPAFLLLCLWGARSGGWRQLGWDIWLAAAFCFVLPVMTHAAHRFHLPLLILWAPLAGEALGGRLEALGGKCKSISKE